MISLSTEKILLIATLALLLLLVGWYLFFSGKSNREGFQATTAEPPTPSIDVTNMYDNFTKFGMDKDRICPMIEVQFNTLNQQLQVFEQKGNEPMVRKLTDMLLTIKSTHEQMKCDEPTLSSDDSTTTQ